MSEAKMLNLKGICEDEKFYFETDENLDFPGKSVATSIGEFASQIKEAESIDHILHLCGVMARRYGYEESQLSFATPLSIRTYNIYHLFSGAKKGYSEDSRMLLRNQLTTDPFLQHCLNQTTCQYWQYNKNSWHNLALQSLSHANFVRTMGYLQIIALPWRNTNACIGALKLTATADNHASMENNYKLSYLTPFIFEALDKIICKSSINPRVGVLTGREMDVLNRYILGHSARDVAIELAISTHTVVAHTKNIYRKLGVCNRQQAIHKSMQKSYLQY